MIYPISGMDKTYQRGDIGSHGVVLKITPAHWKKEGDMNDNTISCWYKEENKWSKRRGQTVVPMNIKKFDVRDFLVINKFDVKDFFYVLRSFSFLSILTYVYFWIPVLQNRYHNVFSLSPPESFTVRSEHSFSLAFCMGTFSKK